MAYPHLLVTEDRDSQHVLSNLLNQHGVDAWRPIPGRVAPPDAIVVEEAGSVKVLLKDLGTRLKQSDLEAIGFVLDANGDETARWQSMRDRLIQAGGSDVPARPDPAGTIIDVEQRERTLRVGIWIMPDNESSGMLEDFIRSLIPDDDPLIERAANCIDGIPPGERLFVHAEANHTVKALVHTWLAWQEEPGRPLGTAVMRHLDIQAELALRFVDWVQRLFSP